MASIVELNDVWKSYDGFQALRGLSLEVFRGEMFGLIGPNGAGKTTTLKIIVGLLKMDRGSVRVNGFNINENQYDYKKSIGYVPESVSLPDYLTVQEFLVYSGKIRSVPNEQIREKMDFYLKTFNLEEKEKSLILALSRGMRQKTAIAAALIHDPDLLILDEPFIGLDPAAQHQVKDIFNARIKENKAIFVSTHMLDTAERMCDRVAVIHQGHNVASGDLQNLQSLSKSGEHATLEEVFLKLTKEAEEPYVEKPIKKKRHSLISFFGRTS